MYSSIHSNSTSQTHGNTMSLVFKEVILASGKCLVEAFVTCSCEGVNNTSKCLESTKSRMKWKLISTCFILACTTRLANKCLALKSVNKTGTWFSCTYNSFNKDLNHMISDEARAIALYSKPTLLLATTFYFEDIQEMRLSSK